MGATQILFLYFFYVCHFDLAGRVSGRCAKRSKTEQQCVTMRLMGIGDGRDVCASLPVDHCLALSQGGKKRRDGRAHPFVAAGRSAT